MRSFASLLSSVKIVGGAGVERVRADDRFFWIERRVVTAVIQGEASSLELPSLLLLVLLVVGVIGVVTMLGVTVVNGMLLVRNSRWMALDTLSAMFAASCFIATNISSRRFSMARCNKSIRWLVATSLRVVMGVAGVVVDGRAASILRNTAVSVSKDVVGAAIGDPLTVVACGVLFVVGG